MREIKFRAWNGEQMISPDYIDREGIAWWKENSIPTTSPIVMQYTGLKDKNGVEIYEGDILFHEEWATKLGVPTTKTGERKGVVEWKHNRFVCEGVRNYWSSCEIIGNIYQNPELLKV